MKECLYRRNELRVETKYLYKVKTAILFKDLISHGSYPGYLRTEETVHSLGKINKSEGISELIKLISWFINSFRDKN